MTSFAPFKIKVCGVKLVEDVQTCAEAGADAVGLNFFPASIRYVSPEDASTKRLADQAIKSGLKRVGVFVNESTNSIRRIVTQLGIDVLQLHGDESIDSAKELGAFGFSLIRAIKIPSGPRSVEEIQELSQPWIDAGFSVLLDVDAGSQHGGSGKQLDLPSVAAWCQANPHVAWTLAGGLTPENVRASIITSGASSVDVASGVEFPRGKKSSDRIADFCHEAKQVLEKQ